MIDTVIIDDSSTSRITLEKILKTHFSYRIRIVASCECVETAKIAIEKFNPELVFLDIEMPNKNGFELLNELEVINFEVIITTSHPEYAIKALQVNAVDYLLKPVNSIDLISAIERFENKFSKRKLKLNNLISKKVSLSSKDSLTKIAFPTENGFEVLKINSIVNCEAYSNYCRIICFDGRQILLAKTLKNVQELLPAELFHRIHKSYLVNLNHIVRYNKNGSLEIELHNGKKLPVSYRQRDNFINVFKNKV